MTGKLDQEPLFLLFLDLRKVYFNLDRGQVMKTLEGYREGKKMQVIIMEFWERQEKVT